MNLTPIRWLMLGGAALLMLGCGEDPLGPEQEAFEAARARWEANGPASYTYEYRLSCFCPPQLLELARVTVTEGTVTDVYLLDGATFGENSPEKTYNFDEIGFMLVNHSPRLDAILR